MNVQRLLSDYSVPHVTHGEHSRATSGWANVHCPFCSGKRDFHMGIHVDTGACHCWRCGTHSTTEALSKLLNLPEREVEELLEEYGGEPARKRPVEDPRKVSIYPFRLPQPNSPLTRQYKSYLAQRGFDPDRLEHDWDLRQTGPASYLDGISYSYRILIPIHWNGEPVTFQARDATDRSDRKYLACPKRREKVHHKSILYGKQRRWPSSNGLIIVEGVTDVWRLGDSAAATFGVDFTMEQVLRLSQNHNRFFIIFDDEPQAQQQARQLSVKLRALGNEALIHNIDEGDPADMSQEDADELARDLVG